MPKLVQAIKVLIASPGDVATERKVATEIINEWNFVHADDRKTVLLPVRWETHATPQMGDRPQGIINKQVTADCDMLVAMFWTRLGTPTGEAPSGTVEEIESFIAAGKPVLIYFSTQPVVLESVDAGQYSALVEFKKSIQTRGLSSTYESIADFREQLTRHLSQTILREFQAFGQGPEGIVSPATPNVPNLSEDAKMILVATAEDEDGRLIMVRNSGGLHVQANGKSIIPEGPTARVEARMESAVQQLVDLDLLSPRGQRGEVFAITDKGFEVVDLLRGT